ncbi:GlxA family transcriptional regulator [Pseudomonas sp. NA-150]|uniref:GlxA family transcriptional regulator n=1 Tax=Pseudomonas sp. NA-150 TaxID=3367525 RepID=UPI0037C8761D
MKLVLVVFDGVQALDVAAPLDVFAEANTLLPEDQRYEVTLVGVRPGNVRCSNGMVIEVGYDYQSYPGHCDLLLVAGGPRMPDIRPEEGFLQWLRDQAQGARRFGSVCNGAFLLGHAGLLDGREATAHWRDVQRFEDRFPLALLRPDKIFVRDGNLFTCAGVSSGIDLCLSLVAEDWGNELSVSIAKNLIVYIHREGGQSQTSPFLAVRPEEDSIVTTVLNYVIDHISEAFSMEQLADAVSVSRRTFTRIFSKYANVTPSVFVDQVRVDHARKMLEDTDVPLKTVAYNCGFHSSTHLRMTFSRHLNTTPKQYREKFKRTEQGAKVILGKTPSSVQVRSSNSPVLASV